MPEQNTRKRTPLPLSVDYSRGGGGVKVSWILSGILLTEPPGSPTEGGRACAAPSTPREGVPEGGQQDYQAGRREKAGHSWAAFSLLSVRTGRRDLAGGHSVPAGACSPREEGHSSPWGPFLGAGSPA